MALFAFWRTDTATASPDALDARLAAASHLVPETTTRFACAGWQLAAFATATRFHTGQAQVWTDRHAGACVLHGLPWSLATGRPLDAAALARLLHRPGVAPPTDLVGEFAVARLFLCGTLEAFGDPAGVHQLFHHEARGDLLANRAGFVAALAGDPTPDAESGLWLSAIGYRVGAASGWRGVRQLPQATRLALVAGAPPRLDPLSDPAIVDGPRGHDPALYAAGLEEAKAACRLAAGDGPLDLPVTGGKDSRAVLALCLAAGLRDRLTFSTRGPAGHPDVLAAQGIATALGLPHRREPPRGSDAPADLTVDRFVHGLAEHVFQTDGGMGGWDLLVARAAGADSLVTGHMGEVLKAFAKGPLPADLDPVALVRLQSPFDPLGLLRADARDALTDHLAADMVGPPDDRPDLFYYRNRIPNWLGGIRGVRSFERQPVMPLAAPSLQRLAFRLTPEERRAERLHHRIVRDLAPELLGLPFAHQTWPPALGEPPVPPLVAAGDLPLFGNWQWSLNHVPAIRVWLSDFVRTHDLALWDGLDRALLLDRLRHHRLDYRDGIALLGTVAAAFHQAGLIVPTRIGAPAEGPRHTAPAPPVTGHVDVATPELIGGWAWSPDWPGTAPVIVASDARGELARAPASANRPDLAAAGIGDGRHGFTLRPTRAPQGPVTVTGLDAPAPIAEGLAP